MGIGTEDRDELTLDSIVRLKNAAQSPSALQWLWIM